MRLPCVARTRRDAAPQELLDATPARRSAEVWHAPDARLFDTSSPSVRVIRSASPEVGTLLGEFYRLRVRLLHLITRSQGGSERFGPGSVARSAPRASRIVSGRYSTGTQYTGESLRAAKRCSVSLGAGALSMETSFTPPSLARTSRSRSRHPSARATSMLYAFSTRRICATAAAAAHTFVMRVRRGRATRGGNEQSSSSGQHGRRQHAQKQHTQQQQPPGLLRHRGHACSREALS